MTGTPNQIDLAEQIKSAVNVEFDRVADAFRTVAQRQAGQARMEALAIIQILEEKRKEVLAVDQAGYFIRNWRELNDQVRQMIHQDARYRAIQASRTTHRGAVGDE